MSDCPHGMASRWACEPCSVEDDANMALHADHGISPAQLREKVEALEKRCDALKRVMDACLEADAGHVRLLMKNKHSIEALESTVADMQSAASQRMVENACIYERLDAALKRIDELERKQKSAPSWQDLGGAGGR